MADGRDRAGDNGGDRAAGTTESAGGGEKRRHSNYNYDEAVLKVQEWNEALKCEQFEDTVV